LKNIVSIEKLTEISNFIEGHFQERGLEIERISVQELSYLLDIGAEYYDENPNKKPRRVYDGSVGVIIGLKDKHIVKGRLNYKEDPLKQKCKVYETKPTS
jgi:hypothetical protein